MAENVRLVGRMDVELQGPSAPCRSGSVTLPEDMQEIPAFYFSECTELTEVELPENLTAIADHAFYGCTGLTQVRFPARLRVLAPDAFCGCSRLENFEVSPENRNLSAVDGLLLSGDQTELIRCPPGRTGVCEVPGTVTVIQRFAFYGCTKLTGVQLPAGLRKIGEEAFRESGLRSVELPDDVLTIPKNAFLNCAELSEVRFPANLQIIQSGAFQGTAVREVTLPAGMRHLATGSFGTLDRLILEGDERFLINDGAFQQGEQFVIIAERMPANSFQQLWEPRIRGFAERYLAGAEQPEPYRSNCLAAIRRNTARLWKDPIVFQVILKEQMISPREYLKRMEEAVALNQPELTARLLTYQEQCIPQEELNALKAASMRREMKLLTMRPSEIVRRAWTVQKNMDGTLKIVSYKGIDLQVAVPEKIGNVQVTAIGYRAFSPWKERLTEQRAEAREHLKCVILPQFIRSIGGESFKGCSGLEEVQFPDGLEEIGAGAFRESGLQSVRFSTSLRAIGPFAFMNCEKLSEVELPGILRRLGDCAFAHCSSLERISIQGIGLEVGERCFEGCQRLRKVVFGLGVVKINLRVFLGCRALEEVVIQDPALEPPADMFVSCPRVVLRAPAGSKAEIMARKRSIRFIPLGLV